MEQVLFVYLFETGVCKRGMNVQQLSQKFAEKRRDDAFLSFFSLRWFDRVFVKMPFKDYVSKDLQDQYGVTGKRSFATLAS